MLLIGILTLSAADAEESQTLMTTLLGPRPDISDYQQRDDFVRDVLAWEKRRATLSEQLANGTLPDSEGNSQDHDWHHVSGPEDLDTALRNAEGYVQPHYQQPYRFDRTTHISFPLKRLPSEQLANKRVAPSDRARDSINAFINEVTGGGVEMDSALDPLRTESVVPPSMTRQQVETQLR